MKKAVIVFTIILTFIISCKDNSDDKLVNYSKDNYSIDYPESWDLDTSGQHNTTFLIFSNAGIIDGFRENVNLVIQNSPNQDLILSQFAELTEKDLKSIPKSKIIKSEIGQKNGKEFYELVWKGFVANNDLHFKQYYFTDNNKAYILTFTALQDTYEEFEKVGSKILDSFKLN